jgi:hypothetical protein
MNPTRLLKALALLVIVPTASAQPLPVQRDGRFGFSTLADVMVIKPQFDEAQMFSEGLAAVKRGGKWGFIGTNGQEVISFQFDVVGSFSEGLAGVSLRGTWGFINNQDKLKIAPRFRSVRPFSEGLAGARRSDNSWIFIRVNGEQGVAGTFDGVGEFSKGIAPVARDGNWAFIDKEGKQRIERTFAAALSFSEDLAAVKDRDSGKFGYISRDGTFAIPPEFDSARSFSEGLAPVQIGERWGYVNKEGKATIKARFNTADLFKEGVAEVSEPSFGKSLYINKKGGIVLTKSADPEPGKFGGGYSWVTNTVDSIPPNAVVFMVPQPDWKRMSLSDRTNVIYRATGRTKLQVRVQKMPFIVLGVLPDGRQATEPFDPTTATSSYVLLQDFK